MRDEHARARPAPIDEARRPALPPAPRRGERGRLACPVALACLLSAAFGCAPRPSAVVDAFPKGSCAAPWRLEGRVWTGRFEQAADAFGQEAESWVRFGPRRVWLANYAHEERPGERMSVRVLSFESAAAARSAYEHHQPLKTEPLRAGDSACWTEDGILVLWGRLVLDIFANAPHGHARPEQAVYLLAFFERAMSPQLAADPR